MARLFKYLAERFPDTLTRIITCTLDEAGPGHLYARLPYECWNMLYVLPDPFKLRLWHHFQGQPAVRRLLRPAFARSGIQWIRQMLDAGEISPDEVLACYDGSQPEVPVTELAKLLVPRGIDPAFIADLRLFGAHSGNLSSWCQSIIDSFTTMLEEDDDPDVIAVASAGIEVATFVKTDRGYLPVSTAFRGPDGLRCSAKVTAVWG